MNGPRDRLILTLLVALVAGLLSAWVSARTRLWDPSCYAGNRCDALTFRLVGRLLERGESPYASEARRAAAASETGGAPPAFDLPFQYPPDALPIFGAAPCIVFVVQQSRRTAWAIAWLAITWIALAPPVRWLLFATMVAVAVTTTVYATRNDLPA